MAGASPRDNLDLQWRWNSRSSIAPLKRRVGAIPGTCVRLPRTSRRRSRAMTRAEPGEAAAAERRRERPGQDARQLVRRVALVEMEVAFLYRLTRAVYPEVDATGPVTAPVTRLVHSMHRVDRGSTARIADPSRSAWGGAWEPAAPRTGGGGGSPWPPTPTPPHAPLPPSRARGRRPALGAPRCRRAAEERRRPGRGAGRLAVRVREARGGADAWLAPLARKPE